MECPFCKQEMINGFLTSDARSIAWRKERHESALVRGSEGIQLARNLLGAAAVVSNAYCCEACGKIILDYTGKEE